MEATMDYTKTPGLDIVKGGTIAALTYVSDGVAYYAVTYEGEKYMFPVNMFDSEDVGTADFQATIKAVTLMRYVRKAIAANQLVPVCTLSHVTAGTLYYTVRVNGDKYMFPIYKRDKGTDMQFHCDMGIDKLITFFTRAQIDGALIKLT